MSHSVKVQGQAVGPLFLRNVCLWSHQTPRFIPLPCPFSVTLFGQAGPCGRGVRLGLTQLGEKGWMLP